MRTSSLRNSTIRLHEVQCKMIVRRRSVVVLERAAVGQPKLANQPGVNQQSQGSINGRPADVVPGVVQVADQLVSIKVLVRIKDMAHKHPTWLGELFAPDLEKLAEFLNRRFGIDHRRQLIRAPFPPRFRFAHASADSCRPVRAARAQIDNDSSFYRRSDRSSSRRTDPTSRNGSRDSLARRVRMAASRHVESLSATGQRSQRNHRTGVGIPAGRTGLAAERARTPVRARRERAWRPGVDKRRGAHRRGRAWRRPPSPGCSRRPAG